MHPHVIEGGDSLRVGVVPNLTTLDGLLQETEHEFGRARQQLK